MKYLLITRYWDSGKTLAKIELVPDDTKPYIQSTALYDEYGEIFDNREDAESGKIDCKNA